MDGVSDAEWGLGGLFLAALATVAAVIVIGVADAAAQFLTGLRGKGTSTEKPE